MTSNFRLDLTKMSQDYKRQHLAIMKDIMNEMKECNAIRYPSYRTAAKVQILHQKLFMQYVRLELVIGVFERHKLSVTENSVILDDTEIEDVISDIFFAAHKESNVDFDVNLATKLAVSTILCTFENQGKVSVFSTKVLLTLLACGNLPQKYEYWYDLLADHNACLSKAALHTMLSNVCKVTELLGESVAYGSHLVQSNIDSCFVESQGCLGVSKTEMRLWLMTDPPLLTWISTYDRLKLAETVIHSVKCASCKVTPMKGARFSCLRCARYHQCQSCFFYGRTSAKHKLKHPIKEYCTKTLSKTGTKPIVSLIRSKLRLCPTQPTVEAPRAICASDEQPLDTISMSSTVVREKVNGDPQKELSSIINHLEAENNQLQEELQKISGGRAERLHRHRETIESQLQRLKILKKYLFNGHQPAFPAMNRIQSTPMLPVPLSARFPTRPEFHLSPIVRGSVGDRSSARNASEATINSRYEGDTGSYVNSVSSRIELSTWIGGHKSSIDHDAGDFEKWLNSNGSNSMQAAYSAKPLETSSSQCDSPVGLRDNTPSSLQRPDKHSRHSSLQNIQGDLNDILNRLQHMVANDCLLEESFSANDNCELKRAATEMEDLLTGLIEGMESRKGKLATIV